MKGKLNEDCRRGESSYPSQIPPSEILDRELFPHDRDRWFLTPTVRLGIKQTALLVAHLREEGNPLS